MFTPKIFLPKGVVCSFVFNRRLNVDDEGAKDDEVAEKILYFIPSDMSLAKQVKYVSIVEAMIEFSSSFDEHGYTKTVKSDKYSYHFSRWESDTWLVMVLNRAVYLSQTNIPHTTSFSTDTVTEVLDGIYRVYSMFYDSIESLLYKETGDGKIIAKEIIDLKCKLRKAKYIEECINSGEINETIDNQRRVDDIVSIQEHIHVLEEESPVPQVRQRIHKVMRKCLICDDWERLHCLYAIDGFSSLHVERALAVDIHTMMTQLYMQCKKVCYSCFLFDNHFVFVVPYCDYKIWSDLDVHNQVLLRHFIDTNQDTVDMNGSEGQFLMDTEGQRISDIFLTIQESADDEDFRRNQYRLVRYVVNYAYFCHYTSMTVRVYCFYYHLISINPVLFLISLSQEDQSVTAFFNFLQSFVSNHINQVNQGMTTDRKISEGSTNQNFIYFMENDMTRILTTNSHVDWKDSRGKMKLIPVTPSAMIESIPAFLAFPMNHIYTQLKNGGSMIEVAEKVTREDWIYGCKQHEKTILVYSINQTSVAVQDILSYFHKRIDDIFRNAFIFV